MWSPQGNIKTACQLDLNPQIPQSDESSREEVRDDEAKDTVGDVPIISGRLHLELREIVSQVLAVVAHRPHRSISLPPDVVLVRTS